MNRKEKYSDYSSGFVDSDLSTDMHDKIMIWLDKNIYKVVSGLSESIDMTSQGIGFVHCPTEEIT